MAHRTSDAQQATEAIAKTLRDIADMLESGEARAVTLSMEQLPEIVMVERTGMWVNIDNGERMLKLEYRIKQLPSIYSSE